MLVKQIRITLQAIHRFDQGLPDYVLFNNLPGAGQVLAPRLLAAFGEQRERYATADELQMYSGIAPVLERSSQKSWVHWRLRCPKFVRQRLLNGLRKPLINLFGQALFTSSSGEKAALIKLPCAHWHSNGFGSFSVAGKIAHLMMNSST
ncbi:transposase [Nitrosospira lacus]|uniref:transposase n=1 Tax=Nitrosospira lacus TaxID=1288494 RepID=UPI001374831B|nr:transposase [Nitrosospira lacus]